MQSTPKRKPYKTVGLKPPEMMAVIRNPSTNDESFNTNAGTHDDIAQNAGALDCMNLSSEEEANIPDSKTSVLEDSGTQIPSDFEEWVEIPSEFDEGVGDIVSFMKEINLQALA